MRRLSRAGFAATIAFALGVGAATAAPQRPDSGVRGLVLYGPTCPVGHPGQSCERPYQATITFMRWPSHRLAARARSGADGHFGVHLRAGRYEVKPTNGRPYPHACTQTVTVEADRFAYVTIRFDSGIR